MLDHERNLDRIQAKPARAAYLSLHGRAHAAGLKPSNNSGLVRAVRLYGEDGAYNYSFVANKAHLLFYIRRPAHARWAGLQKKAEAMFADVSANKSGETKIKVRTPAEAEVLADWLFSLRLALS